LILIIKNQLRIENKKLFLFLYEKEKANWPSVAHDRRGPRARQPAAGEPVRAGIFAEKSSAFGQNIPQPMLLFL
jgi:hypothetical protein